MSSCRATNAKALEAAPARGFPEALRERIAEWESRDATGETRTYGPRGAVEILRDVHAWLASQPVDEPFGHLSRVNEETAQEGHDIASMSATQLRDVVETQSDTIRLMLEDVLELQRAALPSNCTRCNGLGADPPGCPESGPCERCGGWTSHKRLVAGEADALRARVRELEDERAHVRKWAIEEAAREVLATPAKGVVYTPDSLNGLPFVDKADVVKAIRALATRGGV